MKDAEDEAFDELAKRQGHWGGGYHAKRQMAADKLQEPPSEWAGIKAILDEYGLQAIDFVADFKAALAQPAREPIVWECKAGGLKPLSQRLYDAQSDAIKRHYSRIAAQPAQEPVARVSGTYGGRFVYDPINRAIILPVGMALYAGPA
jgi:hypothetical protein